MINRDGYQVDPDAGLVYGVRGKPVGRRQTFGYLQTCRRSGPDRLVHVLVWEAVHGPVPAGMEINHRNGVKTDNRIANLELTTRSGNMIHASMTGLAHKKLTVEQVSEIKRRLGLGERERQIAEEFGVSVSNITQIRCGRIWKQVA